ncbi:Angiotensin-converting enzyme-like protein [Argiope bruennichi]|nr:Angiotensin-converting enzyme-like protein [Argiope bruennichi]
MMIYFLIFVSLNHLAAATAKCSFPVEKYPSGSNTNTYEAMKFLTDTERRSSDILHRLMQIFWDYESDLSELNRARMMNTMQEFSELHMEIWKNATSFVWRDFKDENELVYKWFKAHSVIGTNALPKEERNEEAEISADMGDIYAKAKLCRFNKSSSETCDLSLEPELVEVFMSSRNEAELKYYWTQWREETGKKMKDKFVRLSEINNKVACLNGFEDTGEFSREAYDSETFVEEIEELWQTLKPLYEQLHAYVRRKLIQYYPHIDIKEDGPIPAHILGNVWSESWNNIFDIVQPYNNKKYVNLKQIELKKKMIPLDMFKIAEDFFISLGLPEMTPEFWHYSIIEKQKDKEMVCHASAWDFYNGKDYRIKMCTRVNMEDLIVVHHEMGHIIYDMLYSHQLLLFQSGANPGFHEAIGDTIALSVATPKHLAAIGLTEEIEEDYENDINALMDMALDKVAFLPSGYLIDAWRWKVYDGSISSKELNSQWWNFRLKLQGLCPPVKRTEDDFDPASKYHVAASVPYIRYFVSYIIQFQFHKELCDAAGYIGPLHKCDIYQSKKAGKLLSDMLSLGSSVHWKEAMRVITRGKTSKMDAGPILEYFAPLMEWLKEQNKDEFIGWRKLTEILINSRNEAELKHVWTKWRDVSGKVVKDKFLRYVDLSNEAACLNGFKDNGEMWREAYESDSFVEEIEELWNVIRPFYEQLHAYVRRKLIQRYPHSGIKPDGPIPAHLLGNMWAQTWGNIFDIVKPYPKKKFVDVTDAMVAKIMTPMDMFKMSEEFFTSIGMKKMTPEFWQRSIIEKPKNREMVCHASAWDFADGKDFRIKMCTRVNMEDFITVHHEMGHIVYFMYYAGQPLVFREGANPGFHEAIGDTIALSVATPKHLKEVDLLEELSEDEESDINTLMDTALDKIAFLPFGYLIDAWRWKVFDGSIKRDELNSEWWKLRLKYQGLCPPVKRTNDDLDAAAKYHVIADVPYIRYFVSHVIQFQFHKALCDAAGYKGPLHKCDIYKNKRAGQLLGDMLSLGKSVHWNEAMKVITQGATHKMNAKPLVEYFAPLLKWLKIQNKNETLGWNSSDPMVCP